MNECRRVKCKAEAIVDATHQWQLTITQHSHSQVPFCISQQGHGRAFVLSLETHVGLNFELAGPIVWNPYLH